MVGVIRKRDILAHPVVTIRCFGWPVFLRALAASRQQTFLSLLVECSALRPPKVKVPELLGHCVELELRAKRVYESLAERFAEPCGAAEAHNRRLPSPLLLWSVLDQGLPPVVVPLPLEFPNFLWRRASRGCAEPDWPSRR